MSKILFLQIKMFSFPFTKLRAAQPLSLSHSNKKAIYRKIPGKGKERERERERERESKVV